MNFPASAPWYRRFAIGDQWPNKTSWKLFEAEIFGRWLSVERHTKDCTCSYCRGEHGSTVLWLPADRERGWRVLNFFHQLYIRWVPHRRSDEPRYSKEANYQVPSLNQALLPIAHGNQDLQATGGEAQPAPPTNR